MSRESEYIAKRKKQANNLSRLFKLMRIFPVNRQKIVFSTFEGDGGFCCNPRYIAEEIHRQNLKLKMVWLTNDTSREFPDYIKVVRNTAFNRAFHLSTAKIWVDNYRKPYGTLKRKGQIYIQTWHATIGFKAVGLYRGDAFPQIARIVSEWDSDMIDIMLSNSEYCDRVYPKKLLYNGPTLRAGSPRVDCLINDRTLLREQIRNRYNIAKAEGILLFAPTFRGGNQKEKKQVIAPIPTIDFDAVLKALEDKYAAGWKVFLRLHPQLSAQMEIMPLDHEDERLIDVSQAPDISEIMAACDLVITDYSSCAFDAAFANIPVLLYADDVQEYIKNRGQFMWDRSELPFAIAEDNEQLMANIRDFDEMLYRAKVSDFMNKNGVCEKGKAAEAVTEYIRQICG